MTDLPVVKSWSMTQDVDLASSNPFGVMAVTGDPSNRRFSIAFWANGYEYSVTADDCDWSWKAAPSPVGDPSMSEAVEVANRLAEYVRHKSYCGYTMRGSECDCGMTYALAALGHIRGDGNGVRWSDGL